MAGGPPELSKKTGGVFCGKGGKRWTGGEHGEELFF